MQTALQPIPEANDQGSFSPPIIGHNPDFRVQQEPVPDKPQLRRTGTFGFERKEEREAVQVSLFKKSPLKKANTLRPQQSQGGESSQASVNSGTPAIVTRDTKTRLSYQQKLEIESLIDQIAKGHQEEQEADKKAQHEETLKRQRDLILSFLPIDEDFLLDAFVLYDEIELAPPRKSRSPSPEPAPSAPSQVNQSTQSDGVLPQKAESVQIFNSMKDSATHESPDKQQYQLVIKTQHSHKASMNTPIVGDGQQLQPEIIAGNKQISKAIHLQQVDPSTNHFSDIVSSQIKTFSDIPSVPLEKDPMPAQPFAAHTSLLFYRDQRRPRAGLTLQDAGPPEEGPRIKQMSLAYTQNRGASRPSPKKYKWVAGLSSRPKLSPTSQNFIKKNKLALKEMQQTLWPEGPQSCSSKKWRASTIEPRFSPSSSLMGKISTIQKQFDQYSMPKKTKVTTSPVYGFPKDKFAQNIAKSNKNKSLSLIPGSIKFQDDGRRSIVLPPAQKPEMHSLFEEKRKINQKLTSLMSKRSMQNQTTLAPLVSKSSVVSLEESGGNPYMNRRSMFHDGSILKLRSHSSIHSSVVALKQGVEKRHTMGSELSESMPMLGSTENQGCSMPELPSSKTISKHRYNKSRLIHKQEINLLSTGITNKKSGSLIQPVLRNKYNHSHYEDSTLTVGQTKFPAHSKLKPLDLKHSKHTSSFKRFSPPRKSREPFQRKNDSVMLPPTSVLNSAASLQKSQTMGHRGGPSREKRGRLPSGSKFKFITGSGAERAVPIKKSQSSHRLGSRKSSRKHSIEAKIRDPAILKPDRNPPQEGTPGKEPSPEKRDATFGGETQGPDEDELKAYSMSSTARNFFQNEKRQETVPILTQTKFGMGLSQRGLNQMQGTESTIPRQISGNIGSDIKSPSADRQWGGHPTVWNNINNFENFNQNISIKIQQFPKKSVTPSSRSEIEDETKLNQGSSKGEVIEEELPYEQATPSDSRLRFSDPAQVLTFSQPRLSLEQNTQTLTENGMDNQYQDIFMYPPSLGTSASKGQEMQILLAASQPPPRRKKKKKDNCHSSDRHHASTLSGKRSPISSSKNILVEKPSGRRILKITMDEYELIKQLRQSKKHLKKLSRPDSAKLIKTTDYNEKLKFP